MKKSTYKYATIFTVILCLATLAVAWTSSWFSNWNMADWSKKWETLFGIEQPQEPKPDGGTDTPGGDNQNIIAYNNKGDPIYAGQRIEAQNIAFATASETASITIFAVIKPTTATNKNCTWSIAWQNNDESKNVNDYIKLSTNQENPCEVTISCTKGYLNNKVVLTVTTEDGNYTDSCTITFLGTPTSLTIDESQFNKSMHNNNGVKPERKCCELVADRTYSVELQLNNNLGVVDTSTYNNFSIKIEGFNEYRYATKESNTILGYIWQNPIKASSIVNQVLSCSISDGKLNIKTLNYDYTQGKDVVLTQWLDSLFYKITITETKSNLSSYFFVRFVQGVTGVEIEQPNVNVG